MDHLTKMRRAARRDKTLVIAKRRRDEHLARNHYNETTGITNVDCACEQANTFFAKRTAHGCGCRKRRHGRPKVAEGLCKIGAREPILILRRETRSLHNDAIVGRGFIEPETKRWPKARGTPRPYTIEKRHVSRQGEPGARWTEVRAYRTEKGRDNALEAFQKGVQCYDIRNYQQGAEGVYRGPRYEFRPGPDKRV